MRLKYIFGTLQGASSLTILSTALQVGGGIITLPLALRTLDQATLGLLYTFLGISGVVMLFDFGFATATSRNAAYAMGGASRFSAIGIPPRLGEGKPNYSLLLGLAKAVGRWYICSALFLGILLVSAGTWFIWRQLNLARLPLDLIYCWVLYALVQAYTFGSAYWGNLLMGSGEIQAVSRIALVAQIAGLASLIGGLLIGLGLWSYPISSLVPALISHTWTRSHFKMKLIPQDSFDLVSIPVKEILRELWPMTWRQGIVVLGAFLILRANTIICSEKLGLDEAARYGLTLNLLGIIFRISCIPLVLAMPKISQMRVHDDAGSIWRIFSTRLYLGLSAAGVGVIGLTLFGDYFLKFIGSNTFLISMPLVALLGAVLWLENHHSHYAVLVLSENNNPFIWPSILSGVASVSLSWLVADKAGIAGLIAAQGIIQLMWNNWWTVLRGLRGLKAEQK